jgi:uncharacterized membrane protein YoaK (UPF0700 family)
MMKAIRRHLVMDQNMAETLLVALFLAFSGGYQDAYTFMVRDRVFANAQTGNIVLMSTHLLAGDLPGGLRYLLPLLAFAGGIFAADILKARHTGRIHSAWHQTVVLAEMICLFLVGFLPLRVNILANMLVSFACAMQVETFRRVNGNPYASTMCIGNIRSGTASLSSYFMSHDRKHLHRAFDYFIVIQVFALGAGTGGNLAGGLGIHGIWVCLPFLITAYILMFISKGEQA